MVTQVSTLRGGVGNCFWGIDAAVWRAWVLLAQVHSEAVTIYGRSHYASSNRLDVGPCSPCQTSNLWCQETTARATAQPLNPSLQLVHVQPAKYSSACALPVERQRRQRGIVGPVVLPERTASSGVAALHVGSCGAARHAGDAGTPGACRPLQVLTVPRRGFRRTFAHAIQATGAGVTPCHCCSERLIGEEMMASSWSPTEARYVTRRRSRTPPRASRGLLGSGLPPPPASASSFHSPPPPRSHA
ncbi:uncharacterized protein LOC103751093 [Nannospalax galili]|uniref:uncharacterized protein LOC103751093 n=1 Tax=Nannospalax galili TaxID=1026970 RepID=UPI0004ED0926|nr:uncharacterized protein LOC103751093 [Nannospalax galili]